MHEYRGSRHLSHWFRTRNRCLEEFITIPAIAAIARPVSVIEAPPIVNVSPLEKPSPLTKITAAIIKFLDFVRSTLFSTTFLTPIAEIIPYSINETPPIIADGIDAIISDTFGIKLKITAKIAAIRITRGSYTLESSSTPVFSP